MRLTRHKGTTIKIILIKVGKSIGCKKVSIFGSMISPDFFLLLSFIEDR